MICDRVILAREFKLCFRNNFAMAQGLVFFLIAITLFSVAINLPKELLKMLAPSIIWVALALANLLSQDGFLRQDFMNGVFEQFYLSEISLLHVISIKILINWLLTGLPLVLLTPIIGIMLGVDFEMVKLLFLTIFIGSITLSFIGSIGVALTLGINKSNLLLAIIMLPLYVPVIILGLSATNLAILDQPVSGILALMLAFMLSSIILCPIVTTYATKVNLE